MLKNLNKIKMKKGIEAKYPFIIPNINISDKQIDLINPTIFPFKPDKFISYNNYNFSTCIDLDKKKKKLSSNYHTFAMILFQLIKSIYLIIVLKMMI